MAKKRIMQVAVLCFLVLVFTSFFWELHLIGDSAQDGVLLWNSEEAYLFVGWGRSGYHLTAFEYLLAYIPAYFGVPRTVDDNRFSMIVVRITPAGTERYVTMPYQADRGFLAYVPRGDTIYAYDGGAHLWKWAGTHFETVTPEEQGKLALDEKALASNKDYTNVNGWSSRHSLTSWSTKSEIQLRGEPVTFHLKSGHSGDELLLEIELPGSAPQMIFRTKRRLHLVSKSEYDLAFNSR